MEVKWQVKKISNDRSERKSKTNDETERQGNKSSIWYLRRMTKQRNKQTEKQRTAALFL